MLSGPEKIVPQSSNTVGHTASHSVARLLSYLISYYGLGNQAERIHTLFDLINRESLLSFDPTGGCSYSAINGNGFPVQFSVSLGAANSSLRCLSEVAASRLPMPERLRLSTLRLRDILAVLNRRSASTSINQLFSILFPDDPTQVLRWTGGIWMAFVATPNRPPAFRLYINQRWGGITERFVRIGRVLSTLGRSHSMETWRQIAGLVSTGAIPYGVAFDVIDRGVGQFKVYLTSAGVDLNYLRSLLEHTGLGHHFDRLARWLACCGLYRAGLPPWGILPSLEFGAAPGEPVGLKLDVSCHHLQTSDSDMDQRIRRYLHEFSFDHEEYDAVLRACGTPSTDQVKRIQYCGVGFQGGDAARFNVYFCPDVC